SPAVRRDLMRVLDVPAEKIAVIPLGVDTQFFCRRTAGEAEAVCERLGIPQPFIVYVGTLEPRKNLSLLLRAFRRGVVKTGLPHRLILAGRAGWGAAPVAAEIERLG